MHHEDQNADGVPPSPAPPRRQRTLKDQRAEINELKSLVVALEGQLADAGKDLHEARGYTVKWMHYHAEVATDLAAVASHIQPELVASAHPASVALHRIQGILDGSESAAALKLITDRVMDVLIQRWVADGAPEAVVDRAQVRQWLMSRKRMSRKIIEQAAMSGPVRRR